MKKKIFSLMMACAMIFSCAVSAMAASDSGAIASSDSHLHGKDNISDELIDMSPFAKTQEVPSFSWNLAEDNYVGNFDIVQFTNTNYYFYGNNKGQIYYCISGTSVSNKTCSVRTWCKTCDDEIATFPFTPNDSPFHRVVTLRDHADHQIYFKIVAFDGGWYWSDNDFTGTISISHSYV